VIDEHLKKSLELFEHLPDAANVSARVTASRRARSTA